MYTFSKPILDSTPILSDFSDVSMPIPRTAAYTPSSPPFHFGLFHLEIMGKGAYALILPRTK